LWLERTQAANPLIDLHQLGTQLLQALVFVDLGLSFVESAGGSKGLGYGLAVDFASQAELRIVPGIVGFGTVASGLAAATDDGGNRAWAQIAQTADLTQDLRPLGF
jgi:hypothetical protein